MGKVQGPLFSLQATGTIGKTLTFQKRAGTTAVFTPVSPYDPKSISQLKIRSYLTLGVSYWRSMLNTYKTAWNTFVI
jgi:hypothetical protein